MNPKYHLLVAAAALSLGACSTDDTCTGLENEGYKISFTVAEDPETRTTIDAGDILRWEPTDKVGIYTVGKNKNPNTFTVADVNQHPVEFIGTLKEMVSPGDMLYAYYPYDVAQSSDPTAVKLTIPAEQKQTKAGVYNGETHPLVALPMAFPWDRDTYACRMNSVRFRQLGAIVELQVFSSDAALRSETIRSVVFESETPLAGDFSFDLTSVTDKAELPISGYESKEVTIWLKEPAAVPATRDEAARIYLTIAPGEYMGQIVVKTDAAQYTFRLAEAINFERAVIKGLPADLAKVERVIGPDAFIRFEDPEVKRICVENWDTNGDGDLSYKEAAAVKDLPGFGYSNITSFNELRYFTGLESIGETCFFACDKMTSIVIPDGVIEIKDRAFDTCTRLKSIQLPDGLTSIGNSAFLDCYNLTNIDIPAGVIEIGWEAFKNCSSLTSIHIPDGVTSIGSYAFQGCSSLTSINLPDGVTSIGEWAFIYCDNLSNIHLPDGLTKIGRAAFFYCHKLTSITIPGGVATIESGTFGGCTGLTSVYTRDGLTAIEGNAFEDCSSLKSIHLPDGLTSIGDHAFENCSSLTSINMPAGLTTIGGWAFNGCSSLTSIINIPQTVSSIGVGAFCGCSSLSTFKGKYTSADHHSLIKDDVLLAFAPVGITDYEIPDGVITIENSVFFKSISLRSVLIPGTVTAIGNNAFAVCSNLKSVFCKPTTPPYIGYDVFGNTPAKIYVPEASVEAYKTAGGRWDASRIVAHTFVFND